MSDFKKVGEKMPEIIPEKPRAEIPARGSAAELPAEEKRAEIPADERRGRGKAPEEISRGESPEETAAEKNAGEQTFLLEARRQFIHFLFGNLFLVLILLAGTETAFGVLLACLAAGAIVSILIKADVRVPFFYDIIQTVEREHEKELPGQGAILFFISAIITIAIFQDKLIVLGALSALIYGDSISTIFGMRFGKTRIAGNRTLEGSAAGFVAMLPVLLVLFPVHVALITALAAMLAELPPVNDNFTIPIAAAIALSILL
ncbi:MAG: diacylglycerol/polyprenol kinase family protein [Candidatus Diapherotrites archaeon]